MKIPVKNFASLSSGLFNLFRAPNRRASEESDSTSRNTTRCPLRVSGKLDGVEIAAGTRRMPWMAAFRDFQRRQIVVTAAHTSCPPLQSGMNRSPSCNRHVADLHVSVYVTVAAGTDFFLRRFKQHFLFLVSPSKQVNDIQTAVSPISGEAHATPDRWVIFFRTRRGRIQADKAEGFFALVRDFPIKRISVPATVTHHGVLIVSREFTSHAGWKERPCRRSRTASAREKAPRRKNPGTPRTPAGR